MKTNLRLRAKRDELKIAYEEFSEYYVKEWEQWVAVDSNRADWAPKNPKRIFNLAMKKVYPGNRRQMSIWDFLAEIYKTLGVHTGNPMGLFHAFDPKLYHGKLTLASHFVNLFKARLRANLQRALKKKSYKRRCKNPEMYRSFKSTSRSPSKIWELTSLLHEMLSRLEELEWTIIHLRYWEKLSDRAIGRHLVIDHKKVKRRHDAVINKLRAFFKDAFQQNVARKTFRNRIF